MQIKVHKSPKLVGGRAFQEQVPLSPRHCTEKPLTAGLAVWSLGRKKEHHETACVNPKPETYLTEAPVGAVPLMRAQRSCYSANKGAPPSPSLPDAICALLQQVQALLGSYRLVGTNSIVKWGGWFLAWLGMDASSCQPLTSEMKEPCERWNTRWVSESVNYHRRSLLKAMQCGIAACYGLQHSQQHTSLLRLLIVCHVLQLTTLSVGSCGACAQVLEAKPELASFTFFNYSMNVVHYAAGAYTHSPTAPFDASPLH